MSLPHVILCAKWQGHVGHQTTGGLRGQRFRVRRVGCARRGEGVVLYSPQRRSMADAAAIAVISVFECLEQARGDGVG